MLMMEICKNRCSFGRVNGLRNISIGEKERDSFFSFFKSSSNSSYLTRNVLESSLRPGYLIIITLTLSMMEKRAGTAYMMILTVGGNRHFLIWSELPEAGGQVKTLCYIFDPHMLDERGVPNKLWVLGFYTSGGVVVWDPKGWNSNVLWWVGRPLYWKTETWSRVSKWVAALTLLMPMVSGNHLTLR